MDKINFLLQDKKVLLKVIAGILLLVIAFFFYLNKTSEEDVLKVEDSAIMATQEEDADIAEEPAFPITIIVDVAGWVNKPSVITLPEGSRVYEAIDLAGGLKPEADTMNINLAQVLIDGEKLYVPSKEELERGFTPAFSAYTTGTDVKGQQGRININTAGSSALQELNGVGPSTAEKIIQYRNDHGPFNKIEDLKNVSGIGEKTFEKLKEKITV